MRVMAALVAVGLVVGGTAVLPATPATAQSFATVNGSGSTWSANALAQWIATVADFGLKVSYTSNGSSAGRRDFATGLSNFGVSEIPYQGRDPLTGAQDTSQGREYGYMPIVAGGTAFMYQLRVNGELYRDLRLSGATIARIFTGQVTNWSDPAITADNNGKRLPDKRIVPVVRSDGSGTTAQFTLWLSKQHRNVWCPFFGEHVQSGGSCGLTSYYPTTGNAVAQAGSVQMAGYISASYGDGTIGYVEYSYARNQNYPVVKLRNAADYYVEPTDFNVAVSLTRAEIETRNTDPSVYLTQKLDRVYRHPDPRAYPLSSYSYMILPTADDRHIDAAQGRSLSVFAHYFLCEGQQKAGPLGYSPLPLNLVRAGFDQVERIPGAEREQLRPEGCDNPTFDPNNPDSNRLAQIAPQPPECAKHGNGPCTGTTAENHGGTDPSGSGGAGEGSGDGPGGGPAVDPTTGEPVGGDPTGGPAIDPVTGEVIDPDGDGGSGELVGAAAEVAATQSRGLTGTLGLLAAVQLLLILLIPAVVARSASRRR